MSYPCPSCGYEVFSEPPGSYEICDVCGWEDDAVQLQFPFMQGGANEVSLWEWQQKIAAKLAAADVLDGSVKRCADWRPLDAKDDQTVANAPDGGLKHVEGAADVDGEYYWRKIVNTRRAT